LSNPNNIFKPLHKTEGIEIILEGLTFYSQRLDDEVEDIQLAVSGISSFYAEKFKIDKTTELTKESLHPVIFQYAEEKQSELNEHVEKILTEVESTYTLILDVYERLAILNKPMLQTPSIQATPPNGTTIFAGNAPQQPKEQFNLPTFIRGKKELVSEINPLEQSTDIIERLKQLPSIVQNWVKYHSHARFRAMDISGNWEGQEYLLRDEILYFDSDVRPPLLSVIAAGKKVRVGIEQKRNALIMSKAIEQHEREQANMFMQPQA
jgi:hypothetical protein